MAHRKIGNNEILDCLQDQEVGDAHIFEHLFREHFAFDRGSERWHRWAEHFWERQEHDEALRCIDAVAGVYREVAADYAGEAAKCQKVADKAGVKKNRKISSNLQRRASDLGRFKRRENVLKLTRAGADSLSVSGSVWDAKPGLLALPNGVLELVDGHINFRPGQPKDYIRAVAATPWPGEHADLDAAALDLLLEEHRPHRWMKFLDEIFRADEEPARAERLINFVQRLFGYSLAGDPTSHIFPIFWGPGRNGKSLMLEVLGRVMGDLATPIQAEMLMAQKRSRSSAAPSPDIVALRDKRVVWASEAETGHQFNAAKVKLLTGGDTLSARGMYQKNVEEIRPSHLLVLVTNHLPDVDPTDSAFWHRVVVVPFDRVFIPDPQEAEQRLADEKLKTELLAEVPGILLWLAQGWLAYQAHGLTPPVEVVNATGAYRDETDLVGRFVEECCAVDPSAKIQAGDLQAAFLEWCKEEDVRPLSQNKFSDRMVLNFQKDVKGRHRFYLGLRLKSDAPERKLQAVNPFTD